jgi:curved DNA-binding protein CbpA
MAPVGDLYKLLQVDPEADHDVIRAAYRVLAARHHPDAGGSAQRMAEINAAWNIVSHAGRRAAYDRERRLLNGGDRWDAYRNAANQEPARSSGTILEFGRYAGWSIPEIAHHDPDFLEWLVRTPNGRRYRREIEQVLDPRTGSGTGASPRQQGRRFGGPSREPARV